LVFETKIKCLRTRAVEHSPAVIYLSRQDRAVACNQNRPKIGAKDVDSAIV
jgi:hypothetical protein